MGVSNISDLCFSKISCLVFSGHLGSFNELSFFCSYLRDLTAQKHVAYLLTNSRWLDTNWNCTRFVSRKDRRLSFIRQKLITLRFQFFKSMSCKTKSIKILPSPLPLFLSFSLHSVCILSPSHTFISHLVEVREGAASMILMMHKDCTENIMIQVKM